MREICKSKVRRMQKKPQGPYAPAVIFPVISLPILIVTVSYGRWGRRVSVSTPNETHGILTQDI